MELYFLRLHKSWGPNRKYAHANDLYTDHTHPEANFNVSIVYGTIVFELTWQ